MSAAAPVSVVVPVRDSSDVLDDCLRSLMAQDYPRASYEVIVVDNGSTDASPAIAARHDVRCLGEGRVQTSYAARNAGVRAAAHALIAFTDADCIASPRWLAEAVAGFDDVAVGCVCGPVEGVAPRTWVQHYLARRRLLSQDEALGHRFRPYAETANAVYRRAVFDTIGVFEARWISGGDADLSWRMLEHGAFTLRYQTGAVVYHRHRATVAAMLRQRFRHGQGRALLASKYRSQFTRVNPAAAKDGGRFWQRAHRRRLWKRDVFLESLGVAAFHLGRLLGGGGQK